MYAALELMRRDVFSVRFGDRVAADNIAIVVMAGSGNLRSEEIQIQVR